MFAEFNEEQIAEDCVYYLDLIKDSNVQRFMYRGINSDDVDVDQINQFVPRSKPLASSRKFHTEVNEFLEQKFGHPFRNGLFVTGNKSTASEYADDGGIYIVVPVGKFEWLTNTQFYDLYNLVLEAEHKNGWSYEKAEQEIIDQVKNSNDWIHNTNLAKCIRDGNEMMLWCPNGYYLFAYDDYPEVLDGK